LSFQILRITSLMIYHDFWIIFQADLRFVVAAWWCRDDIFQERLRENDHQYLNTKDSLYSESSCQQWQSWAHFASHTDCWDLILNFNFLDRSYWFHLKWCWSHFIWYLYYSAIVECLLSSTFTWCCYLELEFHKDSYYHFY